MPDNIDDIDEMDEASSFELEVERCRESMAQVSELVNNLNNLLAIMRSHAELAAAETNKKTTDDLIRIVLECTDRADQMIRGTSSTSGVIEAEAPPALPVGPARILVVDDEAQIRLVMQRVLSGEGRDIVCAANSQEALEACGGSAFDLVFMDVRLGDTDGVSLYRKVRKLQPYARVVLLSGELNLEGIWKTMREEGVDGFVTKPFDIEELNNVVARVMTLPR